MKSVESLVNESKAASTSHPIIHILSSKIDISRIPLELFLSSVIYNLKFYQETWLVPIPIAHSFTDLINTVCWPQSISIFWYTELQVQEK